MTIQSLCVFIKNLRETPCLLLEFFGNWEVADDIIFVTIEKTEAGG